MYCRAPAFVSGDKVDLDKDMDVEMDEKEAEEEDDADYAEEEDSSDEEESSSGQDNIDENETETRESPVRAGIGSRSEEPEEGRSGLGLGLGARKGTTTTDQFAFATTVPPSFTSSRGGIGSMSNSKPSIGTTGSESKQAFVREDKPAFRPSVAVDTAGKAAFSKHAGSIGARMMEKMGYQAVCEVVMNKCNILNFIPLE